MPSARVCALALLVVVVACTTDRSHEIDTINPVIGDVSWQAAFGRPPTPSDDPTLRVRTHLTYVEARLRERDVTGLTAAQQVARARVLAELHRYALAGVFPASEATTGLLPTFIDGAGVRCAVADLLEHDTDPRVAEAIDRDYHNAYVAEIDAPALVAWAERAGMTRTELELIQPSYPPPPKPGLEVHVAANYRYALADGEPASAVALAGGPTPPPDELSHVGMLELGVRMIRRHNRWLGSPILGLDGAAGWAADNGLAYDAHLRLGTQVRVPFNRHPHLIGMLAGFGMDAMGDRMPRAWTLPVDLFYLVGLTRSTYLGIVAGPRFTLGGADRGSGWRAGLELIARDISRLHPSDGARRVRDVRVGLGVERRADVTFVDLTVALASRKHQGFYEQD